MSVAVVQSPVKLLELVWRNWSTTSKYATGLAVSYMHSISLQYGLPHCEMHGPVTAFTNSYDDPGITFINSSHGGIKSVVEEVVRDMGLSERELDNKLELIEALLGDDGRQLLESHPEDGTPLKKIIEDELDEYDGPY
jgi:hypothetical protein